jgi:hypothetical protein
MKSKKFIKVIIAAALLFSYSYTANSQVLISLLLGDKLNSPKLKFGLDGGFTLTSISNLGQSKYNPGWDLGFYFDFMLKENPHWYLHTGVIVKSTMGADALNPYHLTNADSTSLDSIFVNGSVDRKLNYFNVPVLARYKFEKDIFVELGVMLGLLYKAHDEFYTDVNNKKDLTFDNEVRDLYKRFDAGGMAGIGYHFSKGTGTDIGIRYYYGFMDILKDNPSLAQRNSSLFVYIAIPIGAGEKAKEKNAAAKKKKEEKKALKEKK